MCLPNGFVTPEKSHSVTFQKSEIKGSQKMGDSTPLPSFLTAEKLSALNGCHCGLHMMFSDEPKQKYHPEDIHGWTLPH